MVVTVSVVLLLMLVFCDALLADKRQVEAANQESRGSDATLPAVLPCDACCLRLHDHVALRFAIALSF